MLMSFPDCPPCILIQIGLRLAANALSLSLGASRSCSDALDNQAAFEFGDGSQDRKNQLSQGEIWLQSLSGRKRNPLEETTVTNRRYALDKWIYPFFGETLLAEITNLAMRNL